MKNIILTGATGFLGSECLEYLKRNYKIYATYRNNKPPNFKNVIWIKLDLTEKKYFDNVFEVLKDKKIYAVVHAGGSSPNRAYQEGNFDATIKGTKHLVELAKKLKVKKFIFISSIVVNFSYQGPYRLSKIVSEKEVIDSGLNYVILRPETIIGKKALDFNRLVEFIKKHKLFPIISNGKNYTQPIGVLDLVKIIHFCLENKKIKNKIYNVVGRDVLTTRSLVEKVAYCFSKKLIFVNIPKFLALIFADIINIFNSNIGINRERIHILSYSRNYNSSRKLFSFNNRFFHEIISFLRK